MNRSLINIAILASALVAPAAQAAAVCYVSHESVVYSSYAFRYSGEENVDQSPQAEAFGEYARQHYGLPASATVFCRTSIYSVAEENSDREEHTVTLHGMTIKNVKTSFQPASD